MSAATKQKHVFLESLNNLILPTENQIIVKVSFATKKMNRLGARKLKLNKLNIFLKKMFYLKKKGSGT